MPVRPTPELQAACLSAIAAVYPSADVLTEGVSEAFVADADGERMVYLLAQDRDALEVGSVYTTWVVIPRTDARSHVTFFRSRVGLNGDDTVPPWRSG